MNRSDPPVGPRSPAAWIASLPTGLKLFVVLSIALLPLALIVFLSAVQTIREGEVERRTFQRATLEEGARRLGARLATDVAALRAAVAAAPSASECARTGALIDAGLGAAGFALVRRDGLGIACGPLPTQDGTGAIAVPPGTVNTWIEPRTGRLILTVGGRQSLGVVGYPSGAIAEAVRPTTNPSRDFAIVLAKGGIRLPLVDEIRDATVPRRDAFVEPVPGLPGLTLELRSVTPPIGSDDVLLMLLPFAMWFMAAAIGWLVVDRLLLYPLSGLRRAVAGYVPGTVIEPLAGKSNAARELRDLSTTFRSITETLAVHEDQLAAGLSRQTRLTREVHHRVKNNLQVVSSLINIHSRGAKGREAIAAFATIQRRVDALAVVHRNHFAEAEANEGIALRSLIGELAGNLRGTAPAEAARMQILVDVPAMNVSQDVAVPIAFLITELVEHAIDRDPAAQILVQVEPDGPARARLSVSAAAFRDDCDGGTHRVGRVLLGLSRQLRSPLELDSEAGRYEITFPLVGP